MGAKRGHNHWPASLVVTRIPDALQIERHKSSAPNMQRVIALGNAFAGVVERAVAKQKTQPAEREVSPPLASLFEPGLMHPETRRLQTRSFPKMNLQTSGTFYRVKKIRRPLQWCLNGWLNCIQTR